MLHHAGGDDELGVFVGYLKGDDDVDLEYEAELAAGPVAASPLTAIPILHSLPGAAATIYLDFDGHFEATWGAYSNITTPVFDIDGDATTFSATELTRMTNIWKRVSEDFAPFQIDVTTEEPPSFFNGQALRISIGGGGGWLGTPAGGVAYIGNFTSTVPNTVFVFPNSLGKNEKSMAEAASHEAGHAFGLQHQSTFDANGIKTAEYNPGGGGWAPIMGVSYYNDLSTWYDGTSSKGSNILQDDLSILSNAINGFGYRADDHPDNVGSGTQLVLTENNVSGSGIIEYMTDVDAFAFSTDAGMINLNVNVAELGANLNAVLELRDSSGALIVSANPGNSLNASISANVPAGDYTLLVKSTGEYGRIGQYTVSGTVNAGLFVLTHAPAEGSVVSTLPTDFQLDFSEAIDPSTVAANELFVNGLPADSFTIVDADSVTYHYAVSPVSSQGLQHMLMAAGSVSTLADGSPLHAFDGTFRYDALPLAVTSTTPANGSTATTPLVALVVNFSEAFNPATLSAGDLTLSQGTVTGFTIDAADTVTFTIAGVTAEGTLAYSLAAGALADEFGNPLVAHSGSIDLDYATTAFPTPLTPVGPLGSGIFQGSIAATIGAVGDDDRFTIELPAGAVVTLTADPGTGLQPAVELIGPDESLVGSQSAAAPGADAVLQTAAINAAGVYGIRVSGVAGTTGGYSLRLLLNAGVESEVAGASTNATPGTAQNIDGSFVAVAPGIARGAVIGTTDSDTDTLPLEREGNNTIATANSAANNFVAGPADRYQLNVTGAISASGDFDWYRIGAMQAGDVLTISMGATGASRGTLGDSVIELYRGSTAASVVLATSDDDGGAGLDSLINRFTVAANDTYWLRARARSTGTGTYQVGIVLENAGAVPSTGGSTFAESEANNTAATADNISTSWRAVNYAAATSGSITSGDVDYYAYQFQVGDIVTLNVDATSGNLDATAALYNSAGTLIANEDGTSAGLGADSILPGYRITAAGTYYVRVGATAGAGNYTSTIWLSSATVPPTPAARGDYFSFSLEAGEQIALAVTGLGAGQATVALTDSSGNVLANGVAGSTNLDEVVAGYVAPAAGIYYAKVNGDFQAPYSLVVNRSAALDREANDDANGALADLDGVNGALGHLDANPPSHYGEYAIVIDSAQTTIELQGAFAGLPLEEQAPGSLVAHLAGAVVVDRQPTFVLFPAGSTISAVNQPGPFFPGNGPANFAAKIELDVDFYAYGRFTGITLDLTSALLGPAGALIELDATGAGVFPANSVVFTFTGGIFDYDVPGLLTGSQSIAGLSETNQYDGLASLTEVDGVLQLLIPVLIDTTMIEPETQLPFDIHLEGQIVASVVLPGPADPVDWYEVQLAAGETLTLATSTPSDGSTLVPLNALDPQLQLLDGNGNVVATDDNSAADGRNASLSFTATTAGVYRVGVHAQSGAGEYVLHKSIAPADPAPRVVNVAVRGAEGTQPWYDIPTGSGDQIRSVPVGNVDQVAITFSTAVSIDTNDLSLTGQGDRPPYTFSDFSYDPVTRTATWTLSAPLDTDQLLAALNADGPSPIVNLAGEALDGEWTNPASIDAEGSSSGPSGNGVAGGDFLFNFTVSPGDATRDNIVDGADYTVWADHYLQAGLQATNGDFNNDGLVDAADYTVWADRFAPLIAAPAAAASQIIASVEGTADEPLAAEQTRAASQSAGNWGAIVRQVARSVADQVREQYRPQREGLIRDLALATVTAEANWDHLPGEITFGTNRRSRQR